MNQNLRISGYLTILFCILVLTFTGLNAAEDYSWVKFGENVESSKLYFKIQTWVDKLKIDESSGVPQTGIQSLDAVALNYGIYNLEIFYQLQEKSMDNPYASHVIRWYVVDFPEDVDFFEIKAAYDACSEIEFTEFVPINKKCYIPEDPQYRIQWHLHQLGMASAWDVSQGSRDIVIGIVDSGIDMDAEDNGGMIIHEDLEANLWFNIGEDANGDGEYSGVEDWNEEDDDDNGYEDDFFGWDFEGRDNWPNDPWGAENGHGTHVAGCASAVTDNDFGVSSPGFSCALMVMGCYSRFNSENISRGYEGLIYCAENGADIINLSWGNDARFNRNSNDNIQFALGEGSIIFAGAGNDDSLDTHERQVHFYPCAYDGVIGVGANNSRDNKTDFSNYGDYTDLIAPGVDILSTYPRNDFRSQQGTSMSSPVAAGVGALYMSVMPDVTNEELLEIMQQTAVDISGNNENFPGIRYRIDAAALLASTHPAYSIESWQIFELNGNQDGRPDPHERISLPMTISNLEGHVPATNVSLHLSNDDPRTQMQRSTIDIGDLAVGEQFEIGAYTAPIFAPAWSHPRYTEFNVAITSDEGWEDNFKINMTIGHPYYLLVDDDNDDADEDGEIDYLDIDQFYHADLDSVPYVHEVYNVWKEGSTPDQDYLNSYPVVVWVTGNCINALSEDDILVLENYLDNGGNLLLVGQYLGNDHGDSDFFRDYLHVNHLEDSGGGRQVDGIAGTIFQDMLFLLVGGGAAGNSNSASTMEPLEGAQAAFNYHDTDDVAGTLYEEDGEDGFKVMYLGFALEAASGLARTTLRKDFINLIVDHFFTVGIADNPTPEMPVDFELSNTWPNPFNAITNVKVSLPLSSQLKLEVIDIKGRTIESIFEGVKTAGHHSFSWNAGNLPTGEYFFKLTAGSKTAVQKVVLIK